MIAEDPGEASGKSMKHNRSVSEMQNAPTSIRLYKKARNRVSSMHQSINKATIRGIKSSGSGYLHDSMAGPGSYNLPALLGNTSIEAHLKNHPAYSIGSQRRDKVIVLSKEQAKTQKGESSPGV